MMAPVDWFQYLRWLRRRPWWALIPAALGLVGGVVAVRSIEPSYRASTLIMLEPARISSEFVAPTVKEDLRDRLATIQQQLTNRETLSGVVQDVGLYPELRASGDLTRAAQVAASNLALRVHGRGRQVFEVSFDDHEPELAAATANRIAEVFIEQSLDQRERLVTGTTSFLEQELEQTRQRLEEQEALIARFKNDHLRELPEQRDTLMGAIESNQKRLELNLLAADQAATRKMSLEREIDALRSSSTPAPSGVTAGSERSRQDDSPYQRLEQLQARMVELRAQFTDRHPDVIRLQREIDALTGSLPSRPSESASETGIAVVPPTTSAYERALRQSLAEVQAELTALEAERRMVLTEIENDQERLRNIPRVETELIKLTRDYDTIESSYRSLLDKRLEAGLAENLEKKQQNEQFRILERAVPPANPVSPDVPLLLVGSTLLGLAAGLGLAFLRFWSDQTLPDRATLEAHLSNVEILGTLPLLEGDHEEYKAKRSSPPKRQHPPRRSSSRGSSETPWASVLAASRNEHATDRERLAVGGGTRPASVHPISSSSAGEGGDHDD